MTKITSNVNAWLSPFYIGSIDLAGIADVDLVSNLAYTNCDMSTHGYTLAGTAEISVALVSKGTLVENKVMALRGELSEVRGKAAVEAARIESKIQSLLAIGCNDDLVAEFADVEFSDVPETALPF